MTERLTKIHLEAVQRSIKEDIQPIPPQIINFLAPSRNESVPDSIGILNRIHQHNIGEFAIYYPFLSEETFSFPPNILHLGPHGCHGEIRPSGLIVAYIHEYGATENNGWPPIRKLHQADLFKLGLEIRDIGLIAFQAHRFIDLVKTRLPHYNLKSQKDYSQPDRWTMDKAKTI